MHIYRRLSLIFALFLLLVILTANLGLAPEFFERVYAVPYADKVGHFLLMGILSLLISLGFANTRVRFLRLLKTCLFLFVVVTIEELSQIYVANRTFSLLDLSADYAGIFLFGEFGAALRKFILHT